MSDQNPKENPSEGNQPKWDYTSREQTLFTGVLVLGLNLLVILIVILDRISPTVHSFFTGKPV